jgi:N-acetylneuraminate lyase
MDLKALIGKLSGVFPAVVTAFTPGGEFDARAQAAYISRLLERGVKGFYVCGSSGEMPLLSVAERKRVLECVVDTSAGRAAVIAHIGGSSPRDAYELARHAERAGADAVSAVTPYYFKYGYQEILGYYRSFADVTSLPLVVYNIPALSGVSLSVDQLRGLLALDNVCGMKFTSNDFYALERVRSDYPEKILYNGYDEMLLCGLAMGADGGIGTTYNVIPEKIQRLYALAKASDLAGARAVQREVNTVVEALLKVGVLPGTKAILGMQGTPVGACRTPFPELSEADTALLRALPIYG